MIAEPWVCRVPWRFDEVPAASLGLSGDPLTVDCLLVVVVSPSCPGDYVTPPTPEGYELVGLAGDVVVTGTSDVWSQDILSVDWDEWLLSAAPDVPADQLAEAVGEVMQAAYDERWDHERRSRRDA